MTPVPPPALTPREQQVLAFIADHIWRNGGVSPSYDEVAAAVGFKTKSAVARIVKSLVSKGRLTHLPQKQRSFVVIGHAGPIGYFRFDDSEKRLVPL